MSNLILPKSCQRPRAIDIFELPDGASISSGSFVKIQNALRNNTEFRERMEKLDKQTGKVSKHLAIYKGFYKHNEANEVSNNKIAEKILMKRAKEEKLNRSIESVKKTYTD